MKLEYNLFGVIPTSHEVDGYTIYISSLANDDDYGRQTWTTAATYLGAIFTGWRLARMYAAMEGIDNHYIIYPGTGEIDSRPPIRIRTIRVTKKVAFFSK